jgi:DNA-nicking Smr family endonuclease
MSLFNSDHLMHVHQVTADGKMLFKSKETDAALFKKMMNGEIAPFATLDLHGLTVAQAEIELYRFLQLALRKKWFLVKIVHGKGGKTYEDYPILKNQVNRWLRSFASVVAFCSTPQRFGGTGSVYVWLECEMDKV